MSMFGSQSAWQGHERLAAHARRAVQRAQEAAIAQGCSLVTPDLLLGALLSDVDGVPALALRAIGVDLTLVWDALRPRGVSTVVTPDGATAPRIPLDPAAREAVVLGVNEARRGGFGQAGAGHLLLGIVESREGAGARALARCGARLQALREAVNEGERAASGDNAAAFADRFAALLEGDAGSGICSRCSAVVHDSFQFCYRCGAQLSRGTDG